MRFMMLMIPEGYENAAPGTMPELFERLDLALVLHAFPQTGCR